MMDTLSIIARAMANRGKELMVFDWNKAAQIISEREVEYASAGLRDDWESTGGGIFKDGKPIPQEDTYTYLASTWAVPELDIDGDTMPCYLMEGETDEWDAKTYWPESALEILAKGAVYQET